MHDSQRSVNRRHLLSFGAASVAALAAKPSPTQAAEANESTDRIVTPPVGKRILLSCKLGMIARTAGERPLTLIERLKMAADAGLDGVDFDEAGAYSAAEARQAVRESGVFVHNAINHAHWDKRLTSPKEDERATGRANIEHCLRVSHAAGGSGVLIVIGHGKDGPEEELEERCRQEIKSLIPIAASLGQMILFENVWNLIHYNHNAPPEQGADRFIRFVDSFNSPWVGMYYDLGNHWKYGQPAEWIRAFGHRCVKLDAKGFSRKLDKFTDITSDDDDLPWDQVRKALDDIGFSGWVTAEVKGGDVARLTQVRKQMQKALGV